MGACVLPQWPMSQHADDAQPRRSGGPEPIRYPRARLSPAKDELMILAIPRDEVEAGDIAPIAEKLGFLSETPEMATRWEGRIGFVFEGWDDDPRETAEIPAIRVYFAELTLAWPYWLHFAEKVGDTVPHVLRLCCRGRIEAVEHNLVGWRFGDLGEVKREVERQFIEMNRLYAELGLPATMKARVAEEVAQLLENALH